MHISRKHLHMNSGHGRWTWLQLPTKVHYSKHTEAKFLPNLRLHLQFTQMPRSPDLAIFDDDNDDDDTTDYFTPCACIRGNYIMGFM